VLARWRPKKQEKEKFGVEQEKAGRIIIANAGAPTHLHLPTRDTTQQHSKPARPFSRHIMCNSVLGALAIHKKEQEPGHIFQRPCC
jgi:hypothetical protein